MSVTELKDCLAKHWLQFKKQLVTKRYVIQAVCNAQNRHEDMQYLSAALSIAIRKSPA